MPRFQFRCRRKKQPDLLQIVRDEIHDAIEWKLYRTREFVPRDRLRAIWTVDRLAHMADRYGAFHTFDIPRVLSEHIQALSLLVDIQWEDWSAFRRIFLSSQGVRMRRYKGISGRYWNMKSSEGSIDRQFWITEGSSTLSTL
ncbi:hypothetical protein BJX68DRAFT_261027 [Aspergillus pseudodeflectus]|uniref:Uncharacterized protein n=1 Tax=Aspergillus pseudodeflectus TaxID=176178 RepID=A0ABR4L7B5_9EURO